MLLKHKAEAVAMDDFSARLLQIPVMLVTVPQPLSNCQAQPFVFLITPEKASLPVIWWAPWGGCIWGPRAKAALPLLFHAAGCRLLRESLEDGGEDRGRIWSPE